MVNDCNAVWDRCLHTIKDNVNQQSFKTWFKPITPVALQDNALTVQVPNKFFYEWLEEHYVSILKKSIKKELGTDGRLEYQILMRNDENQVRVSKVKLPKSNARPGTVIESTTSETPRIKNPFVIPGIKKFKVDSQLNPSYTFDAYIEGDCNRLARSAGKAISDKPGGTAFNPLVVYGKVGLGKTHLAQAIGNDIVKKFPEQSVLYVSAEKFTAQIIQSIRNNAIDDLVNFYQLIDVLIVDDVQFLANKVKTQEIFFHIFNQLHQSGKQLILTSDRAPKDLEGMEARLLSRFKWGLTADLQVPDFETRMAILNAKLDEKETEVPQEVLELLAFNVKSNIRELEGVLISLLAQASLNQKSIDTNLAKDVIEKFVTEVSKEITVENIKSLVADHFNIPIEKLHAKTRKREVVIARQLSMYLAKRMTDKSLKNIGDHFGGRDHSTVIYSCKAVQDLMDTDAAFKATVAEIEKKVALSLARA